MANQKVVEGGIVNVQGYEMIARNVHLENLESGLRVAFKGECTDSPRNDDIRHTPFNGGSYAGNSLVYDWDENLPVTYDYRGVPQPS